MGPAIENTVSRVHNIPRDQLLNTAGHDHNTEDNPIPFVTTYHPEVNKTLNKILKNLYPILCDDTLKEIFPIPPRIVNKQPPNFGNMIVSSKLYNPNHETGTYPCHVTRCLACQHICTDTVLSNNFFKYVIRGEFCCRSSNIVYLIKCSKCPDIWYFGESSNSLHTRLNGHRQTIVHHNVSVPVGHHFNLPNHSIQDLNILVVKDGFPSTNERKKFESFMIAKFHTNTHGLNRDIGILSNYKSIVNTI